jgi:hypothetical protein
MWLFKSIEEATEWPAQFLQSADKTVPWREMLFELAEKDMAEEEGGGAGNMDMRRICGTFSQCSELGEIQNERRRRWV